MKDPLPSQVSQPVQPQQQRQVPRSRIVAQQPQQQQQQPAPQQVPDLEQDVMEMDDDVDVIQQRPESRPKRAEPSYQDGTHGFAEEPAERNSAPPTQPQHQAQQQQQRRGNWRDYRNVYRGDDTREQGRHNPRAERWEDRRYEPRGRFEPAGRLYSDNLFQQQDRGRDQRYRQ